MSRADDHISSTYHCLAYNKSLTASRRCYQHLRWRSTLFSHHLVYLMISRKIFTVCSVFHFYCYYCYSWYFTPFIFNGVYTFIPFFIWIDCDLTGSGYSIFCALHKSYKQCSKHVYFSTRFCFIIYTMIIMTSKGVKYSIQARGYIQKMDKWKSLYLYE